MGSSLFARHYSGNHSYFLFLPVLRCFSSRGWLSFEYYTFSIVGCPIRRSRDITLVCNSPWLIAAYHVLLRLSDPRHPPCALIRFKKFNPLLLARLRFLFTSNNYLLDFHYNFLFPNMSKNFSLTTLTAANDRRCLGPNLLATPYSKYRISLKELAPDQPILPCSPLSVCSWWRITDSNR